MDRKTEDSHTLDRSLETLSVICLEKSHPYRFMEFAHISYIYFYDKIKFLGKPPII